MLAMLYAYAYVSLLKGTYEDIAATRAAVLLGGHQGTCPHIRSSGTILAPGEAKDDF